MRNEAEMMALILGKARQDDRIRAVVMNGSRTNPNAPKDCFQDYDIVYAVRDMASFLSDHSWVGFLGGRIMLQLPDATTLFEPGNGDRFGYLILLDDGNRVDLSLVKAEKAVEYIGGDSLTVALLDKDGILPEYPPSSDRSYRAAPPDRGRFADCCNEFWWVLQNTAKGIWRDELPYAMRMFTYSRDMLDLMIGWHVGMRYNFAVCTGKCGKYFKNFLSKEHWQLYRATYSDCEYEHLWGSVDAACTLFRGLANEVALHFGFDYPKEDDERMSAYLSHVKRLPGGSPEIL